MDNRSVIEKSVAREILNIIEEICFGDEYCTYRVNRGSNGVRDLIIKRIKEKYEVG